MTKAEENKEKLVLLNEMLKDLISHDRGFLLPEWPAAENRKKYNSLLNAQNYVEEMLKEGYYRNL